MNPIDLEAIFKEDVDAIFKKYSDLKIWEDSVPEKHVDIDFIRELLKREYAIPKFVHKNALLFLGFNPSYKKSEHERELAEAQKGFTDWKIDGSSGEGYFKEFRRLFEQSTINEIVPMATLDILFMRETTQGNIEKLAKHSVGADFIQEQLEIFNNMIHRCEPKIIVVANAGVRNVLFGGGKSKIENMEWKTEFDEGWGTHKIELPEALKETPVFLSSMLSGARALDIGSRERLEWHLKYLAKQMGIL